MLKNSIVLTFLFVLSSTLGFVCQMLYGKYFGAGGDMDVYYAYNSVPSIITGVLPVVFSSLLIPLFPFYENNGKLEDFMIFANRRVLQFSTLLVFIAFLICCIKISLTNSPTASLEFKICCILWIAAFFSIMNSFYVSYVNYRKKFIQVSLTSLMTYTSILIMVFVFHKYFGVISIVLGLLVGALIRFITMNKIMNLPKRSPFFEINKKKAISWGLLVFATLLPFSAFPAIAYFWAGGMEEGSVSYLGYSHSFQGALSVAGSMGVATVSFPDLAKALNTTNKEELLKTLTNFTSTLKAVFFFISLIISFCCVFVVPVSSLLLERGEFSSYDIQKLSLVLPLYFVSGGVIAELNLIRNVYYSLKKFRNFAFISVAVTFSFFLTALVLRNHVSYIAIGITECCLWILLLLFSMKYLISNIGNFIMPNTYWDCLKYATIPLLSALLLKTIFNTCLHDFPLFLSLSLVGAIHIILSIITLTYVFKTKESRLFVEKIRKAMDSLIK